MRQHRHLEVNVLGYRIERVQQVDASGDVAAQWYEVMKPYANDVLGHFAHRAEAERDIIVRELSALPRPAAAA